MINPADERQKLKAEPRHKNMSAPELESGEANTNHARMQDPQFVLSMLEADQLVAAKGRTRFGRRRLSLGTKLLLWGLRIYVILMLVIVLISVVRALHGAH